MDWSGPASAVVEFGLDKLFGDKGPAKAAKEINYRNMINADNALYKGIQIRTADAKEAGIHPLYALGAQTTNFSPVPVGGDSGKDYSNVAAGLGQGISSAINAVTNKEERAVQQVILRQQLTKGDLENDLLRSQIALNSARRTPGLPSMFSDTLVPGQGDAPMDLKGSEAYYSSKLRSGVEYATTPANKVYVGYDGKPVMSPASEYSESMEGNWPIGMIQNLYHNTIPFYRDRMRGAIRKHRRKAEERRGGFQYNW